MKSSRRGGSDRRPPRYGPGRYDDFLQLADPRASTEAHQCACHVGSCARPYLDHEPNLSDREPPAADGRVGEHGRGDGPRSNILIGVAGVRDIGTRADCERLVRTFYGRALEDPIIGYVFTDVAKLDLEEHVPKITAFWETVLLGAQSYRGGAFAPHAALHMKAPLRRGHFERWLWLWRTTVDELFAGERAELAKSHANRVAMAFHGRLEAISAAALPDRGLVVTQHG